MPRQLQESGDQDGGQWVEPPVRTGEKLASVVGDIRLGKVRLA